METLASTPVSLRGWMGCSARLLVFFLAGVLLLALRANSQTTAEPGTQDKISPDVRQAVAEGAGTLPLLIELRNQPQADILRQAEAGSSRLTVAKFAFERMAGYGAAAPPDELAAAQEELFAATTSVRQSAAQAIRDRIGPAQDNVNAALLGAGATGIYRFYIVNLLSAEVPASAIAEIAKLPDVARIALAGSGAGTLNTAAALGAPAFWAPPYSYTGLGQVVAVLDSGIDQAHPAFAHVAFEDHIFLDSALTPPFACPWDEPRPPTAADVAGHGTAISDTIAGEGMGADAVAERGVAYGVANILNVKVSYKCEDDTTAFKVPDVLAGLQFAVFEAHKTSSIVNLSLSTTNLRHENLSDYVDRIVDLSNGLVVTVGAGNAAEEAFSKIHPPGTAYNAITVGAEQVNEAGKLLLQPADFTTHGLTVDGREKPDLSAPGDNLTLANNLFGTNADEPAYNEGKGGTSYAAPQVAGAAALLLQLGVPSEVAVKALLINSAVTPKGIKDAGYNRAYGWGYMRLGTLPALLQRTDGQSVCVGSPATYASACVTDAILNAGSLRWYQGAVNGDFKATLVWNRHFTNTSTPVASANPALDIDKLVLTLFHLQGGAYTSVASSSTPKDNVQQVHATENGKVLVKVKMPGSFVNGVRTEPYGLAFSTALTPAAGPLLNVNCTGPQPAQPLTLVSVACTVTNSGGLPVFATTATAPPGTIANNGALGTLSPGDTPFTINVTSPDVTSPAIHVLVTVTGTLADETYTATTAFYVSDAPQGCPTPILTPAGPVTVPAAGATYTVTVTGLPSYCHWVIQLSDSIIIPWITSNPLPGLSETAPGSFTITAAPNTGSASRVGGAFVSSGPNLNGIIPPSAVFKMTQLGAP